MEPYKISFWGCGNVSYRLSIALKTAGNTIPYICARNIDEARKLAHILNKKEISSQSIIEKTEFTDDFRLLAGSDVVIMAVSDDAIEELAVEFSSFMMNSDKKPVLLHTSGASSMELLNSYSEYGVIYPLMTLSKIKPVDFKLVPFFIEASDKKTENIISDLVRSIGSEYKQLASAKRLEIHLAAVFVSNFVNYLIGLAIDLSKPNQTFLMPLAIETVRKAFLYEHPTLVQTGPAKRGDITTIKKHLELLAELPQHRQIYEQLSELIAKQPVYTKKQ